LSTGVEKEHIKGGPAPTVPPSFPPDRHGWNAGEGEGAGRSQLGGTGGMGLGQAWQPEQHGQPHHVGHPLPRLPVAPATPTTCPAPGTTFNTKCVGRPLDGSTLLPAPAGAGGAPRGR